jgi:hypothetical protein
MPTESEPTFAALLQETMSQGRVVLTLNPAPVPPPRDEKALLIALCMTFRLSDSEARLALRLLASARCTPQELCEATVRGALAHGSMKVILHRLRKKLAARDIEIVNSYGTGYALTPASRSKIIRQINRYDQGLVQLAQPADTAAAP